MNGTSVAVQGWRAILRVRRLANIAASMDHGRCIIACSGVGKYASGPCRIGEELLLPLSVDYDREETLPARTFGDIRLTLRWLSIPCLSGQ